MGRRYNAEKKETILADRKHHPNFALDIPRAVSTLRQNRVRDQMTLEKVIGTDSHGSSQSWYFRCYERLDVHRTMVNDSVRTGSYALAIGRNRGLFKGKVVLDVGTGTGVLSIFSAKEGGAAKVYAVDASAITRAAELLIEKSNLKDKISVIRAKVEDLVTLPDGVDRVDIIVSEWMGYGLLSESVLDSVIHARQRFLKHGGFMLPDTTTLKVVGSSFSRKPSLESHVGDLEKLVSSDMTGRKLDLSLLPALAQNFTLNWIVHPDTILTSVAELKTVDMYTIQLHEVGVESPFAFTCKKSGLLKSFVFYFDVLFDLPNAWQFSTGPESRPTHWLQTVASLPRGDEVNVWKGTEVFGHVSMQRIPSLPRFWTIKIDYTVKWLKRDAISNSRLFYLM